MISANIFFLSYTDIQRFQRLSYILFPAKQIPDYFYKLLEPDHIKQLESLKIDYKILYSKITIWQFFRIFEIFVETKPDLDAVQIKLLKDLKKYEKFLKRKPSDLIKNVINSLIKAYFDYNSDSSRINNQESQIIQNIFKIYDRPLSLQIFLEFLKDFGIVGNPFCAIRFLKSRQARRVYNKICLNGMSFSQFKVKAT